VWIGFWASLLFGFLVVAGIARWLGIPVRYQLKSVFMLSLLVSLPTCAGGAISSQPGFRLENAAFVGAIAALAFFVWFHRQTFVARVTNDLRNPARRARAMRSLRNWIDRRFASGELTRSLAGDFVSVSAALIDIDEERIAAEWLSRLDPTWLDPDTRTLAANNEAVAWLTLADLDAARTAIAKRAPTTDGVLDQVVQTTSALIQALDGDHARALARVDALGPDVPPALEGSVAEVRATALAGLGETERARDLLRATAAKGDLRVIRAVLKKGGPASALAKALLDSRGTPYR